MKNNLIIDLGMHRGMDTEFYLAKGFSVAAVEANPALVDSAKNQFNEAIEKGRLEIFEVAIAEKDGEIEFFVNKEKDDWSSIFEAVGGRQGCDYERVSVKAMTLESLLRITGIPYYLKIDIEHADHIALKGLHAFEDRPKFVSCECHSIGIFFELDRLGYTYFKLVNQKNLWKHKCVKPALEGQYVDQQFSGIHSGPFGEEAQGDWVSIEEATYEWLHKKLGYVERTSLGEGWYDIHAKLG